jgi:hypothetical protein
VGRTKSTIVDTAGSNTTSSNVQTGEGTGTHIRANAVLSASHTLHSKANPRVGFERFELPDPAASVQVFYGLGVLHPMYDPAGISDHDIGLMLLLNAHDTVVGGMLATADSDPLGTTVAKKDVTMAGYNNQGTYMEGNVRAKLGEANFDPAIDKTAQTYSYRTASATPAGTSKHYTQSGDSGGPTFYHDGTNELLVGVHRSSAEPDQSTDVRVDTHRPFIDGGSGTSDRTLDFLKAAAAGNSQNWSAGPWSRGSAGAAEAPKSNDVVVLDPTKNNDATNTVVNLDANSAVLDGLLNDVTLNISGKTLDVTASIGATGGSGVLNGGVINVGDAAGSKLDVGFSLENVGTVNVKKNGAVTIGAKLTGTEPVGVLNGDRAATLEVFGGGTLTVHNSVDRVMFTNLANGTFKLTGGADGAALANIDRFLNQGTIQIGDKGNLDVGFKLVNTKSMTLEGSSAANVAQASVAEFARNVTATAQLTIKKNGLLKAPKGIENNLGTITLEGGAADQLARIEGASTSGSTFYTTENVAGVVALKKFSSYTGSGKFGNYVNSSGVGKLLVSEAGNVAGAATMEVGSFENIGAEVVVSQFGSLKVNGLFDNASTNSETGKVTVGGVDGKPGTIQVKKLDNSADVTVKAHGMFTATGMGGVSVNNTKNFTIEANGAATLHDNVDNSGKFTVKGSDIAGLKTLTVKKVDETTARFSNKAGGAIELDPVIAEFDNVDLDNEGDLLGVGEFLFVGQSSFINQRATTYPTSDFPYDTRAIDFTFQQAIGSFEVSSLAPNDDPIFGDRFGLNDPFAIRSLLIDDGSDIILNDIHDNQVLDDALFAEFFDVRPSAFLNINSVDFWVHSDVVDHLNQLIGIGSLYDGTLSPSQSLVAQFVPQFGATHIEVVPEPATNALLACILAAVCVRRRV